MMTSCPIAIHDDTNYRSASKLSFREISRSYFRTEHAQALVLELLVFFILAAISLWPIFDFTAAITNAL